MPLPRIESRAGSTSPSPLLTKEGKRRDEIARLQLQNKKTLDPRSGRGLYVFSHSLTE